MIWAIGIRKNTYAIPIIKSLQLTCRSVSNMQITQYYVNMRIFSSCNVLVLGYT